MTISRGLMRVVLATVAVGGVLVTYGATRNAISAATPTPTCNCNTWRDCDSGSNGWKCTSELNLCTPTTAPTGCGGSGCAGYCEKSDPEGGQPR
jgi:hypothetical protein